MDWVSELPTSFASRISPKSERNCPQIEEEGLADFTVWKNHQHVYGRHFTIQADHKSLLKLLFEEKGIPIIASTRMQEWAVILLA